MDKRRSVARRGGEEKGMLLRALPVTQGLPSVGVAPLPVGLLGDGGEDISQARTPSAEKLRVARGARRERGHAWVHRRRRQSTARHILRQIIGTFPSATRQAGDKSHFRRWLERPFGDGKGSRLAGFGVPEPLPVGTAAYSGPKNAIAGGDMVSSLLAKSRKMTGKTPGGHSLRRRRLLSCQRR